MSIRAIPSPVREADTLPLPSAMGERERRALTDFLNRLESTLPGRVERCILFGSWARGEGRPGSDLDLLLVVDHRTPAIRRQVTDLAIEVEETWGVEITPLLYDREELIKATALGTPLILNVAEEGIVLKGEPVMVEEGQPEATARHFLESAHIRLRSARLLKDAGDLGNAISLVFYAFLDAADAALAARGIRTRSHAGTLDRFGFHFIRPGLVDRKYSRWFQRARKWRLEADYERRRDFSVEEVEEIIAQAAEFIAVVESLIASSS